jgi:hypothetical protein
MSMKPSRKRVSRRLFLGGASVAIGLPFLETLTPRHALGQEGAAPKRFVAYFSPNGFDMEDWRPIGTGAAFQFGPMMTAAPAEMGGGVGLEPFRDQLLLISGLQNTKQETTSGDHAGGIGSFLTNRTVPQAAGASMGGPSIDYLISTHIGQESRRPYFAMGGEPPFWQGDGCDSGYPCAVGNHITFDNDGLNVPRVESPGEAFDLLFEGLDPDASAADVARRYKTQSSILDTVLQQSTELSSKLSYQDRPRLEEYLTSIREVERRIQNLQNGGSCMIPTRVESFNTEPEGYYYGASILGDHLEAIEISHELLALGLQCDSTRVISFMWGNMTSARNYAFIGASGGHHDLSHHGGGAEKVGSLKKIGRWEYNRFAEFLQRLKDMPDLDGRSVLDNTLIFQSSDISDGDSHNHDDMPVVLAGGGAGFTMGRHVEYPGNWFGELFLAIAQAYGVPDVTSFGEHGTAPLAGLKV